jgi:hypothetical protein
MRFSTFSILTLAGSAIAAPAILAPRDDSIVKYNIKRVYDSMQALDTAFTKKPRANANQQTLNTFVDQVLRLNGAVISELRAGADDMRRAKGKVNTLEVVGLQSTLTSNDRLNNDVVSGWIDIKKHVATVRRMEDVLQALLSAQREFSYFSDSLILTLPSLTQSMAQSIKTRFNNNLDKAIREYRR